MGERTILLKEKKRVLTAYLREQTLTQLESLLHHFTSDELSEIGLVITVREIDDFRWYLAVENIEETETRDELTKELERGRILYEMFRENPEQLANIDHSLLYYLTQIDERLRDGRENKSLSSYSDPCENYTVCMRKERLSRGGYYKERLTIPACATFTEDILRGIETGLVDQSYIREINYLGCDKWKAHYRSELYLHEWTSDERELLTFKKESEGTSLYLKELIEFILTGIEEVALIRVR